MQSRSSTTGTSIPITSANAAPHTISIENRDNSKELDASPNHSKSISLSPQKEKEKHRHRKDTNDDGWEYEPEREKDLEREEREILREKHQQV